MPKNPAAVSLGSKGGKARSRNLSKARKIEIAKLGAKARIESLRNERLSTRTLEK